MHLLHFSMLVLGKKRKSLHRLFFDDSIFSTHPAVRNHRQFTFNEKGKYIDKANRERAKAKLEKLQAEISRIAKTTGIAVENKAAIIQPKKFFVCTLFFIYRFDKLFFSSSPKSMFPISNGGITSFFNRTSMSSIFISLIHCLYLVIHPSHPMQKLFIC